jgi:hypothetical protein
MFEVFSEHGPERGRTVIPELKRDVDDLLSTGQKLQRPQQPCLLPPASESHAGLLRLPLAAKHEGSSILLVYITPPR